MPLKLWTGGSGQGKTYAMVEELIRLSQENPDKNYYVIVPEQFGLEMQREIIKRHPRKGYFNIDVLSFHRLAYRVFDECRFQPNDLLEDLGVSMILRKILTEKEKELLYFKKSARKAGFIDELKSMLMELICYGVSWDQMLSLEDKLKGHPNLAHKCREIGIIYRSFEEYIDGRFMVAEQILGLASDLVAESDLLKQGIFYFDGFTGFTPVQLTFLQAMLHENIPLNITVTMEGKITGGKEDLFFLSKNTVDALKGICQAEHVSMEDPVYLQADLPPRFKDSEELAYLERYLFRNKKPEKEDIWEDAPEKLHMVACRNPEAEAHFIAHKIEELVRTKGYRYRDFAVLSGDADGYASAFRRQCDLLHIPVFEDTKKKMSYYSGIETIRALFHLAEMDYSYESVFRYLKSGMSDFTDLDIDYLENYVLATGVRGIRMWKNPFTRRLQGLSEEQIGALQSMREQLLFETEYCSMALRDKEENVKQKMTALYETMVTLHYEEKLEAMAERARELGDHTKAKEYERLFGLIIELLDKIVSIFGEETMSLKALSEVMDAGLEAMGLGVEPLSMDQLVLGDLKRTRLPDIRILFIAGMNDGKIPPAIEDRGLLRDDEKHLLGELGICLSEDLYGKSLEEEFYLYLAFTKPKEEIYFTFARMGKGGDALRPSGLWHDLVSLFPAWQMSSYPENEKKYIFNAQDSRELLIRKMEAYRKHPEEALKDPTFLMLLRYWEEEMGEGDYLSSLWQGNLHAGKVQPLTRYLAKELYGEELVGTITRLERFASCPYQYFCTYGLSLQEREEYQIRPVDIGNIFHAALEHFAREVKVSDYNWKSLTSEAQEIFIQDSVKAAVDEKMSEVLQSTARNQYKIRMVERILRKTIDTLRLHLKKSQFEPDAFELRFGKPDHLDATVIPLSHGNTMRLEGVIDRVDIVETDDSVLVKIIDYKSGNKAFEYSDLYYGLDLQLVIYMNAARELYEKKSGKRVIPAAMYYYTLKDPIEKKEAGKSVDHTKAFRMNGVTNKDPQIMEYIEALEPGEQEFLQAKVKYNKNGSLAKTSEVAETEDFVAMGSYAKDKAKALGDRIYEGEIEARPYKKEKKTACDFCPYVSVCGFDPSIPGYTYEEYPKRKAEDILKEIRGEAE